ncbi:hypothetical protein SADUNF_Sadunf03G0125600 [Salix dunnii]|uniref:SAM domain-containing protein n=1 Tax=Salix dunnii TaxID=1413687 RepID=A0A835N4I8_9ROSI|nr:hypothetical protein SADUNF_Sadunf03G0125600 [Salix dunnii]
MAAELLPPEGPITTSTATTTAPTATEPTKNATTAALAQSENRGRGPPSPVLKRQRRPSVRLGEIGDHHHQTAYESHVRRSTKLLQQQHNTWRIPKESSKSIKARSLTHLVNGNDNEIEEIEVINNNQNGELNLVEFGHRRKAKRATTKRVRSNWISSNSRIEEGDNNLENSNGEEGFVREFDLDSDSPTKEQSPVHSADNVGLDFWHGNRRTGAGSGRVMFTESRENEGIELENNDNNSERKWEGVRTWLIDLGLSRYAPVFELHEVDDQVLPLLTLEDLKDMGINAVGSRRKLYSAIQKLRKGFPMNLLLILCYLAEKSKIAILFLGQLIGLFGVILTSMNGDRKISSPKIIFFVDNLHLLPISNPLVRSPSAILDVGRVDGASPACEWNIDTRMLADQVACGCNRAKICSWSSFA